MLVRGLPWCRTRDLLEKECKMNLNFGENMREVGSQYDQELADLRYDRTGLQVRLAIYDSHSKASCESLCVSREYLKAYLSSYISSHFLLESDLTSGLGEYLMRIARFVNETFGVHRTSIVELVSSGSDALELEYYSMVEVLHSAEHSGISSSANRDPPVRSPYPLSLSISSLRKYDFIIGDFVKPRFFLSHVPLFSSDISEVF